MWFGLDAHGPVLFGHRGCAGAAPENTIAAFARAADDGVPAVELDVQITRDGRIVVFHDNTPRRFTSDGSLARAQIADITYAQLRDLDVGSHFSAAYAGERVPELTEVFERFGRRFVYDVEIKDQGPHTSALVARLADILNGAELERRLFLSSFSTSALRLARRAMPDTPISLIHLGGPIGDLRCALLGVDIRKPFGAVRRCPRAHRDRVVWTVNSFDRAQALVAHGAAGVVSDTPAALLGLFPS